MNTVAIIPARGGSKSIPGKNIKALNGIPLIAHAIKLAQSIPAIDRVIVSTDSEEIAAVAKEYGAEVPFIRPAELAQDETPTQPVLEHCVAFLEKQGYHTDIIALLYPTNPFLSKKRVEEALQLFDDAKCHSVISVQKDFGKFWKREEGRDIFFYPKKRVNRQWHTPLFRENGAIYFSRHDVVMKLKQLVDDDHVRLLEMGPEEVIDIDTPEDWAQAESWMSTQ